MLVISWEGVPMLSSERLESAGNGKLDSLTPGDKSPLHAMSVDVEDYFHVAALSSVIRRDQWDSLPSRVQVNTERLLSFR